jgi:hypothetical protein
MPASAGTSAVDPDLKLTFRRHVWAILFFVGLLSAVLEALGFVAILCCWLAGIHIYWQYTWTMLWYFLGGTALAIVSYFRLSYRQ